MFFDLSRRRAFAVGKRGLSSSLVPAAVGQTPLRTIMYLKLASRFVKTRREAQMIVHAFEDILTFI